MHAADSHLKADLLLVLVTLLAAAGWIFSKEALAGLPPLLFIGVRFLLAGMLLSLFGWRQLGALARRGWLQALLVGTLFAVAMGFWIMGLANAKHLGEGAFISSLGIVLVPVLARFLFGDKPPRSIWVAIPMALLGFGCLSLEHGFRVEPGQWWFFAAALTFALVFVTNSHVVRQVPVIALGTVQLTMVGVLILPLSWLFETWPTTVSTPVLGWALASALFATTMRFIVQLQAQGMTTPSHAAIILMLEPMLTAIVAAWWFGESMSLLQFVGCGLIFLALVVSRWSWIRGLFAS